MNRSPRPLILLALLFGTIIFGQTARDTAVEVSATVQAAPPAIFLNWLPTTFPVELQKVLRKNQGASAWTDIATLATDATTYLDSLVAIGSSYEYQVIRIFTSTVPGSASGYLNAGIRLPLKETRGRVLLIVDDSIAAGLATELAVFTSDLIGDGWTVARQDVPRSGTPAATKLIVQSLFNTDPASTRTLILFGHIPVPYSGDLNPDGHPDHRGAWPADVYYADMNGVWSDTIVNDGGGSRVETRNTPGDGKFDQSGLPSDVELEVGRIDLANLPLASASLSEVELLRQYLNRDHAFRFRLSNYANVPRRGLISDNFGYFSGEAFAASGWRNFSSFFGSEAGAIVAQAWFPTLENEAYLWAYGCGSGTYDSAGGVGSTYDFGVRKCLSVFNLSFGSYFGDWDVTNSFLRAPLAGLPDSLGLVNAWAGRPHWHLYHMALGETVGFATRTTQNNGGFSSGGYVTNVAGRGVHIALMGDPTLRLHPVLPVTNLAVDSSSGSPALTWTASADSDIEGYVIFRAVASSGPFENVSGLVVAATTFIDRSGVPGQSYYYQVRAVKLEGSASGTYFNNSQGIFAVGSFVGPVTREIQLTGLGKAIPNGQTLATSNTGTDFGKAETSVQSVTRSFVLANDGTGALSFTSSPAVQITGANAGDFTVLTQPGSVLAGGGNVSFSIRFAPSAEGVRTAKVQIGSDDSDESAYHFAIQGIGTPLTPEISVTPLSIAETLPPDSATPVAISVANAGAGALDYTLATSQSDYSFRDSASYGGPQYAWIDISATGTELTGFNNPDDAMSGTVPIGFTFPFYGINFTTLQVCTNAFISFGDAVPLFFGPGLPGIEAPGNVIAAFWNDLILDGSGHIYTQRIGDLFVIQFENIARFGALTERVTCEIVLRQTGEVFIQYKQVPPAFVDYSIGIQDASRSRGLRISFQQDYARPQLAVRITPPGFDAWLATSVTGGSVAPGEIQNPNALLTSTALEAGYYHAFLHVDSEDANEPRSSVPVQLTVSGPEIEVLGNGLPIVQGDVSVLPVKGTDFGMVAQAGGTASRIFILRNKGTDVLTLGAVTVSGAGFTVTSQPAATVNASTATTFEVAFTPTLAGAASGVVTFTSNDADEASYSFSVAGLGLTPAEGWRLVNFGAIGNAGEGADSADPDGDGLRNLLEYGFTLNPKAPGLVNPVRVEQNASGYFDVEFTRNTTRTDLTYNVQGSTDLVTWTSIARSTTGGATLLLGARSVLETGTGDIRTTKVEDSFLLTPDTRRFLRVEIIRN